MHRTILVCNLHRNVTCDLLFELFYQVGPIDCIKFAVDEYGLCKNFAMIIFKHAYAVRDSFKYFCGTKLYGLPIVIKYYWTHIDDPVFYHYLDYFKHGLKLLLDDEQNSQFNEFSNYIKCVKNQSSYGVGIPDSLPELFVCDVCNIDTIQINDKKSNARSKHRYIDMKRHQSCTVSRNQLKNHSKNHNSDIKNEHSSVNKFNHYQRHCEKSKHNSDSSSTNSSNYDSDLCQQNDDLKHKDIHFSSTLCENQRCNQEYTKQSNFDCRSIITKRHNDKIKLSRYKHKPYLGVVRFSCT